MNIDSLRHFSFNFRDIVIDEIALNGLEGIGFDVLWKYVEKRISASLTTKVKNRFWECINNSKCISFYEASEPLPSFEILDRFMLVDEQSGQLSDPPDYLDGPYEYSPVQNEHGSCSNYHTRTLLHNENISSMSYEEVVDKYGNRFVMVASFEERWHAIAGHMPLSCMSQLTSVHYCILELIAKGRENGQMTIGKSNLTKIVKEPKLLFYNRKQLKKLDLIRVQCITQITANRGVKSLLLRIKRFHRCRILSMPKRGKLYNLTEYLRTKPDYSERCDVVMRKGYVSQPECKKLKKTINVFRFNDKYVTEDRQPGTEKKKQDKIQVSQKRKFISLAASDDESSQSDEENNDIPLENQYKIGVNILRQAYERFIDAGLKGLTQVELGQLLGIEFYTSRTICRCFRSKNIVREFLEDKGRQRTARYIAVAATSEMDNKYAAEKEKLLQNFNKVEELVSKNEEEVVSDDDMPIIPLKKIKLEGTDDKNGDTEVIDNDILEVKVLDGLQNLSHESLLNPRKSLSLRQLRFANGLFKVMQEKQAVGGYQTLSALVAEKIGEPPMDTKALKLFVQKLVTDGRLKILKIKWPGFHQKYSVLICAAHVKSTSPVIRAKYKDICLKAVVNRKSKTKNHPNENITRPLSQFAYPRYMKIQKLHELIIQLAYFNSVKQESYSNPGGISSLLNIIPEMTVAFALGNISNIGASDIAHLKVNNDLLNLKLRDTPTDFYRTIIQSKSMQDSIRSGLKVLGQLGLIQLLVNIQNAKFYVNRHAKIIDTSGTWPRETEEKPIEKKFYFGTLDDVKNYWDEVYSVSTNTQIVAEKRERYHVNVPLRKENEVEKYDNAEIYGDGKGPCGFHSSVYMEVPRLWDTLFARNNKRMKNKVVIKKNVSKAPKAEKQKRKPRASRKSVRKVAEELPLTEKPPKTRHSDINIKWSPHDDETLIICKAAITIMSPNSQAGCLKVKNTVARTLLSLKDPKKTGRICHRRSTLIESDANNIHKKDCILNELRRHRHLIQKYEDVLRRLKIRYCANMTKYVNEGRLVMLELIWIIYQVLNKGLLANSVGCIAENYDDFINKYTITSSFRKKSYNLYKTPVSASPEFATLKEGIIMTVMHSFNRELDTKTAKKIYCIFEVYSEEVLRSAIEQLRKSNAMAAKEKVFNNQMNRVQFNDIVRSSFKISACYKRKWLSRLNSDFIDSLTDVLETEVSQTSVKGFPGINCAFFEMHSCDVLDIISVTVPVIVGSSGSLMQEEQLNVIDIEMKFKLKAGVAGWKNKSNVKRFCDFFENCHFNNHLATLQSAPIVEYIEDQILDLTDPIVAYLNDKQEGATFRELQEHLRCDDQSLITKLFNLEQHNIIKRIGYYENRILLMKFLKQWLFNINNANNKFLIPNPWMTLNFEIRYDILINWTGVIMNRVFESPGCSVAFLSEYLEFLTTRNIQDLCTFLEKCECVILKSIELREVDLFSDDDYVPEIRDFNPYESPEHMLVFPVKSSLTKYAFLRKKILDKTEADV